MGYGSYSAGDWQKLKASRGLSSSSSANQTFRNQAILDKYNARFIDFRESFDSEDSPESTPIIIGFDVTGSMGYLAKEIATNSLNETIMQILEKKPVTDPHMLCAAFTNSTNPLQVTQFEADIRVVEQLLDFKLGGGNRFAYDNILWYFAANHTKTDCFSKRGKKGILIGIGDEVCGAENNILHQNHIYQLFGDEIKGHVSFQKALADAEKKYHVGHIVVGGNYRFEGVISAYEGWKAAAPGRVAKLHEKNISYLSDVIVAMIEMMNGKGRKEVLDGVEKGKRDIVRSAIEDFGI